MKLLKTTILALTAALASASFQSASASPLISIGDNADVFFSGSSSMRWSSNVFRDESDETSDLAWTFSPGFELNVGRGQSNADFSIVTRYDIVRYSSESQLDTELFHITARGFYSSSRLDLSGSASFDESKSSTADSNIVNDLIEFDTTAANLNSEYRFSPKLSFGAGVRYREVEYQTFRESFADRDTISFPFDLFHELTPKVDLSVGYTYSDTDVKSTSFRPSYDQQSHFYNIGARGELLPKLNGFFKVGYRTRSDSRAGVDESGILGLDANLSWAFSPKLTATLGLSRDFGVGGEGDTTENTGVDISASYAINTQLSAISHFGYTYSDYGDSTRKDDQYRGGIRLNYIANRYWNFSGGYSYNENSSNSANRSYDVHSLNVTASLRY